jgi:hypothetical protein
MRRRHEDTAAMPGARGAAVMNSRTLWAVMTWAAAAAVIVCATNTDPWTAALGMSLMLYTAASRSLFR